MVSGEWYVERSGERLGERLDERLGERCKIGWMSSLIVGQM